MSGAPLVGVVLASAFFHALWNALLKRQREPSLAAAAGLGFSTLLAGAVALLFGRGFDSALSLTWAFLAGLTEAAYFSALGLAMRLAPLGRVYAVARGGAVLALWPLSLLFLGEEASPSALVGAALVVGGLFLTGLDSAPPATTSAATPVTRTAAHAEARRTFRRGLLYAAIAALCIALYNLFYKLSLEAGGEPMALYATSVAVALPVNLALLGRQRVKQLFSQSQPWGTWFVFSLIVCLSFWLFLLALEHAGAARMTTLRNTSLLFALGMAWMMGERPTRAQALAAGGIVSGAALLAWR